MLKRLRRLLGRDDAASTATNTTPAAAPFLPSTEPNAEPCSDLHVNEPPTDNDFVMPFEIRPLQSSDDEPLRQLFRHAVEQTGAKHHDANAVAAWSACADDVDFMPSLQQGLTLVATLHGEHAGFAQLHPANHIEMLYLSPDVSGLGIAALLYQHLEDEARIAGSHTLSTVSSLTAQRFFESMGWMVNSEEEVLRQGVAIKRLRMDKVLVNPAHAR